MSQPFGSDSGGTGDIGAGSIGADATGSADGGYTPSGAISGQSSPESANGAWNEVLSAIPREFHPMIKPHLQKFDSNYGRLSQEYAPWKKTFADQGRTPEDLVGAQRLYELVNSNPALVYAQLGSHLENLRRNQPGYQEPPQQQPGTQQQQFQQGQQDQQGQQQEDGFDDPRMQQMYTQMQQMQNMLQQQAAFAQQQQQAAQQQAMTDSYEKRLDSGIREIMKKDSRVDVEDLLQRAYVQVAQGGEPDLNKAYAEQQAFVARIRSQPLNSASAPTVMPTGGGMPPTIDTSRPKTNAEKSAKVRAMLEAANQQ